MFEVTDFRPAVSRPSLFSTQIILLMLIFLVTVLMLPIGDAKLIGDHVCQTELTIPQEEQIWELKNRTIRTYKWCLNVPPRCAEYSTKLVNESKIMLVNVKKQSESCCNGFKEYKNYCVSECADCENGVCIKGFCVCQAGWTGPECNSRVTTTDSTTSTTTTTTLSPLLDRITLAQTTELFTSQTPRNIYTSQTTTERMENTSLMHVLSTTTKNISKDNNITLDIFTIFRNIANSHSESITTLLSTTKDYASSMVTENYQSTTESVPSTKFVQYLGTTKASNVELQSITTHKSTQFILDELEGSGSKVTQNWPKLVGESTMMFDATDQDSGSNVSESSVNKSNQFDQEDNNYSEDNYEEFGPSLESIETGDKLVQTDVDLFKEGLMDAGISTTAKPLRDLLKPSITKNLVDNENSILKEHLLKELDNFISERHEERSSIEELRKNTKLSIESTGGKNLIYSICAAALTTFLILVAAVTMYAMKNSRKKMEKEKGKTKRNTPGVAVYGTSIFHTPLPDPPTPTCENPIYPMLVANESKKRKSIDPRETMEIQEFNVVFHKPIRNPKLDTKLYLYDHPPSTGSYRASSEVDTLSQYNISQRSNPEVISEPVYDEIPSKDPFGLTYGNIRDEQRNGEVVYANSAKIKRGVNNSGLYMNTTCRTKF